MMLVPRVYLSTHDSIRRLIIAFNTESEFSLSMRISEIQNISKQLLSHLYKIAFPIRFTINSSIYIKVYGPFDAITCE